MPADHLVRDTAEAAMVVAVGGMLWTTVRRLRAGQLAVHRCGTCGRPTSRAYPACTHCGAARPSAVPRPAVPRDDNGSDHS